MSHDLTAEQLPEHVLNRLPQLQMFADGQAMRYGSPVYLVGSCLSHSNPDPRDWDVRCIMADSDFEAAYGPIDLWNSHPPQRPRWRWATDCTKQSKLGWSLCPWMYIDFQTYPALLATAFQTHPRFRLDRMPMLAELDTPTLRDTLEWLTMQCLDAERITMSRAAEILGIPFFEVRKMLAAMSAEDASI